VRFIEEHIGLVKSVAGKYAVYGVSFDDLVQEGLMGLFEAKKNYDPGKGAKFSTYATYHIKGNILKYLQKEKKIPVIDADISESEEIIFREKSGKYEYDSETRCNAGIPEDFPEKEKQVLYMLFYEHKTLKEIAENLGFTRERARQLKQKALRRLRINRKLTQL